MRQAIAQIKIKKVSNLYESKKNPFQDMRRMQTGE